jgi:cyclophilin family peptidyl-prolyl cis-trans isomerase
VLHGITLGDRLDWNYLAVTIDCTPWLDGKHAVFGRPTAAMDVADPIEAAETDPRDRPLEPVVIESVTVEERRS